MKLQSIVVIAATILLLSQDVAAYKILFISAVGSKSHKVFFSQVSNVLADHGHQVTLVSTYKPAKERKNIREIFLDGIDITSIMPSFFEGNAFTAPLNLLSKAPQLCNDALSKPQVQEILNEEYDLGLITIFISDCFLTLFHQLKIPFITVNPAGSINQISAIVGNPPFASFVHSPMGGSFHPFTFTQRIKNVLIDTISTAMMQKVMLSNIEAECRQRGLCPADMPSLEDMKLNTSLLLVNSIRAIEEPPRPTVPAIINIGGLHCQKAKSLPQDLDEWIAGAGEDGFIFFSLGSVVKPSTMPEAYRKILVKTFASLKQRVLWKWNEDSMEDLPPNVRLGKWLPQQDILGDSRLRLFITHGGYLSTQESMYHGTPVIGLPVFADQMTNMAEVDQQGWGRSLKWSELTEQLLTNTIQDIMANPKFREEVKRRSGLMRDQPMDPGQNALFWVEYVVRHNGAHHLKSPTLYMPWYALYNVDVWLTVLAVIMTVLYIVIKISLKICRVLCCSKSSKKKKD